VNLKIDTAYYLVSTCAVYSVSISYPRGSCLLTLIQFLLVLWVSTWLLMLNDFMQYC